MTDGPTLRGMQTPDIREATADDLEACARVWHASLNDYLMRLNQPEWPFDPAGITAFYAHLLSTDPARFLVAVRSDPTEASPGGERIVAFVSAVDHGYTVDFWIGFCAAIVASELAAATETRSVASGRVFMPHRVRQLAVLR